jgi:phosphohistidine phosphatase SixA
MTTTFIFVRHGSADKFKNHRGKTVDRGLTPDGVAHARSAGQWLQSLGIVPDLIVHTTTPRTSQTSEVILKQYGGAIPIVKTKSGFRSLEGLHKKLEQWTTKHPSNVVLFCGHHTSQQALTKALNLALTSKDRGVVVVGLPTKESRTYAAGATL